MNGEERSWRSVLATMVVVFTVTIIGTTVAFALWMRDISEPQIAILGSGDRLSLLVMDGPARLIIASGDDSIAYENALSSVLPLFARRVDVLIVSGQDNSLLVPLAANGDPHVRSRFAFASLPDSPETTALGPLPALKIPSRIRLGPNLTVAIEAAWPFGADPEKVSPSWRMTIERDTSCVVVLSDGKAAALFPPLPRASLLAVVGDDPVSAWEAASAVAFVANANAVDAPEMRSAFANAPHPPSWTYRIAPGESLRVRFTANAIELPSEPAQPVDATPAIALADRAIS